LARRVHLRYLIGEKYIDPNHYVDGESIGDNQGPYVGDDRDSTRWADIDLPPVQDTANADFVSSFGSAHPGRFFMAMCDGSIQGVRAFGEVQVALAIINDYILTIARGVALGLRRRRNLSGGGAGRYKEFG
jgi:hypothetical protein